MEYEDTVEPQDEPIEQIVDDALPEQGEDQVETEEQTPKMVPLSALQKLREKKKELELELQWERQRQAQQVQQPPEEDISGYESATKDDLRNAEFETLRKIEERFWIKQNPALYEYVNENLPKFLKQRPNLAVAINQAENRYQEACELMQALNPKDKRQVSNNSSARKEAPNSPSAMPKSAAMSDAVDVMGMTDNEFRAWRESKKRRR